MRKTLLAAAAAFVIGGATVGSLISYAQPVPPPGPGPGMGGPGWHHGGPVEWMRHWREAHGPVAPGAFALVFRQADRNLTPTDVQKIAEAFLLWHGNHSWKVVDVAANAGGAIGFALATQQGSVIARFTMDPHTGRVTRVG
ncbi:MAG TPA: hypothetical protein VND19_03360 [Acetobacteraceae bacterium]|nr:hypothetical protein [Acetobacteraceae bacterium]